MLRLCEPIPLLLANQSFSFSSINLGYDGALFLWYAGISASSTTPSPNAYGPHLVLFQADYLSRLKLLCQKYQSPRCQPQDRAGVCAGFRIYSPEICNGSGSCHTPTWNLLLSLGPIGLNFCLHYSTHSASLSRPFLKNVLRNLPHTIYSVVAHSCKHYGSQ